MLDSIFANVYTLDTHRDHTGSTAMKSAAMRIRVEPELHNDFLAVCKSQDLPASLVLRQFMKTFVEENIVGTQKDLFDMAKKIEKTNK